MIIVLQSMGSVAGKESDEVLSHSHRKEQQRQACCCNAICQDKKQKIASSETWISYEKGVEDLGLFGYKLSYVNHKKDQKWGGIIYG